jgi:hypothetical protein
MIPPADKSDTLTKPLHQIMLYHHPHGTLHDISKVERNNMIALNSLAGRRCRLVDFAELGLEADRTVIDLGDLRQDVYPRSVLLHVTDTVRMNVSETLVTNNVKCLAGLTDAKDLTGQVLDLPSSIFFWSSRIETGVARSAKGCSGGW